MAGTKKTKASGSTRVAKASAKKKAATKKSGSRAHRRSKPRITLSFVSNAITVYGGLAQLVIYLHAHNPAIAKVLDVVSSLAVSQFQTKLDATRDVSSSSGRKGPFDADKASDLLLWAGGFPARLEELARLLVSADWIEDATDDELRLVVQLFTEGLVRDHGGSLEHIVLAAHQRWTLGRVPPAKGIVRKKIRI